MELDESEWDPGRRVSDRLDESAKGLGESSLKRKTLNSGLCALYKHLILSLRVLYSLSYPEHETLSLHFSTFKLSFHFG